MGGRGSGRHYRWDKKDTVESRLAVDIRKLNRDTGLNQGDRRSISWSSRGKTTDSVGYHIEDRGLILEYRVRSRGGEWRDCYEVLLFDYTPCNFGGQRLWILRPVCQKRVAIVYGVGDRFICRKCGDLTYASQQESEIYRPLTRLQNIQEKLGGSCNVGAGSPARPKGMHWRTYVRFMEKYNDARDAYLVQLRVLLGKEV